LRGLPQGRPPELRHARMSERFRRRMSLRRLSLFALPALIAGSLAAGSGSAAGAASDTPTNGPGSRPSIVLIMTDDQRPETLDKMPQVQQRLTDQGVSFSNSFVVNPECCPSRAATLTGNYSHDTGVYRDQPPHG